MTDAANSPQSTAKKVKFASKNEEIPNENEKTEIGENGQEGPSMKKVVEDEAVEQDSVSLGSLRNEDNENA